ncbi:MAG: signal peptidase I [Actinomycetota bacterium]
MSDGGYEIQAGSDRRGRPSRLVTIGVITVAIVLAVVALRWIMFAAYQIPSASMAPALEIGDRILVNQLDTGPNRGDIVVYVNEGDDAGPGQELVGRVIAVGGESIAAVDGQVTINDNRLVEPYLEPGTITSDFGPLVVPSGQLFIMGDNREAAFDSRGRGPIPEENLVGTVVARSCCPPGLI